MKDVTTEDLIKELERRGSKWGYIYGHGSEEPAGNKGDIIADVEKTRVLISPDDLFEKPIPYDEYFWEKPLTFRGGWRRYEKHCHAVYDHASAK